MLSSLSSRRELGSTDSVIPAETQVEFTLWFTVEGSSQRGKRWYSPAVETSPFDSTQQQLLHSAIADVVAMQRVQ